jgi:hypothetical protein
MDARSRLVSAFKPNVDSPGPSSPIKTRQTRQSLVNSLFPKIEWLSDRFQNPTSNPTRYLTFGERVRISNATVDD